MIVCSSPSASVWRYSAISISPNAKASPGCAKIFADPSRALGNPVTNHQQQETAGRQITGHPVDELGFIQCAARFARQRVQHVALAPCGDRHLSLQILIAEPAKLARIVEDLADHLTACLRVAPELALHHHHQPAMLVNQQDVDKAGPGDR
jgi:hypothetical protein